VDQLNQIQRAVDFIEEHLSEELEIGSIAKKAGYSTWHFQRVFAAMVGENVKAYVRKRRLTRALIELGANKGRIIDIAIDAGFESQEAFTRAFKSRFGLTPGEARAGGVVSVLSLDKPQITMAYLDHLYKGMSMEPRIMEKEGFTVAGMGAPFISILSPNANNFEVIPPLWGHYLPRAKEIQRSGDADYGIVYCLNGQTGECFYLAGAALKKDATAPQGMETRQIPRGRYAIFIHKGKLDSLAHTMNYIHGSWMPKSGHRFREGPEIEVYDERFIPNSDKSELEIWIPIE
jgi:AraC family transcriptional regulator